MRYNHPIRNHIMDVVDALIHSIRNHVKDMVDGLIMLFKAAIVIGVFLGICYVLFCLGWYIAVDLLGFTPQYYR